jgi:NAD(P)-dependent dehydrogenase (short-subunit alcohol dehydrogenase family)
MKTWCITGTSRGIGLEFCKQLLASGHSVIGCARNPEGARDHWELTSDFGSKFLSVELDVSSQASIENALVKLKGRAIDVLVNNAGVLKDPDSGLMNLSFEDLEATFRANTFGPMRVTKAILPLMRQAAHPKVISITSKMGSIADNKSGGYYSYRMSKAALNMFHASFAIEEPKVISAVLHPGWVQTSMGGQRAPTSTYDSVKGMIKVIEGLKLGESGCFKDYLGATIPW